MHQPELPAAPATDTSGTPSGPKAAGVAPAPRPRAKAPAPAAAGRRSRRTADTPPPAPAPSAGEVPATPKAARRRGKAAEAWPVPAPPAAAEAAGQAKPARKAARKQASAPPEPPRAALVRDSFTFPEDEYVALASMKRRLVQMGHEAKKTELVRAALMRLAALEDADLLAAAQAVPRLVTGRPKHKGKSKHKG